MLSQSIIDVIADFADKTNALLAEATIYPSIDGPVNKLHCTFTETNKALSLEIRINNLRVTLDVLQDIAITNKLIGFADKIAILKKNLNAFLTPAAKMKGKDLDTEKLNQQDASSYASLNRNSNNNDDQYDDRGQLPTKNVHKAWSDSVAPNLPPAFNQIKNFNDLYKDKITPAVNCVLTAATQQMPEITYLVEKANLDFKVLCAEPIVKNYKDFYLSFNEVSLRLSDSPDIEFNGDPKEGLELLDKLATSLEKDTGISIMTYATELSNAYYHYSRKAKIQKVIPSSASQMDTEISSDEDDDLNRALKISAQQHQEEQARLAHEHAETTAEKNIATEDLSEDAELALAIALSTANSTSTSTPQQVNSTSTSIPPVNSTSTTTTTPQVNPATLFASQSNSQENDSMSENGHKRKRTDENEENDTAVPASKRPGTG